MLLSSSAFAAATVTLAWDASLSTNIAGYKIHYGTSSGNYTGTLSVGNATTGTVSNLVTGTTYYFAATAVDTANLESDFSNEVSYTNVNQAPVTIVLTSPANNAGFTAPATISLAASVSANGHSITKVQFYNGPNLLGEDTASPYTHSWTSVPAGSYSLKARVVYDASATLDSSPAVNVTVASPKPTSTPPTISTIADQTTPENIPTAPIPFVIADAESPASSLLLSAATSDPLLVPTNNIAFGGSDTNRTIIVTPLAGVTGAVQITVFVSDESFTTNTTFTLTIDPAMTPVRAVNSMLASDEATVGGGTSTRYNGLFYESDAVRLNSAGSFSLSLNSRGKYSGRLQFGKKRYSFSGLLNGQGATNTVTRKGGSSLTLDFHISGTEAEQVSGHVTDGTWQAVLAGDKEQFGKGAVPPFAGTYTLVMPGYETNSSLPAGASFGSVKVSSTGKIKLVGTLADGTKVSQSVPVAKNGFWPLYVPLYSGYGSIMSWMTFASDANSDLSGRVIWLKQAGAKSKYYTGGFSAECQAAGSTYFKTAPILNLPTANLVFYGGSFASEVTNAITISTKNKVGTPGKDLKLNFSASKGIFKGTFADPATGKRMKFSGAVFQKLNAAYGVLFGAGDQTSEVRIHE